MLKLVNRMPLSKPKKTSKINTFKITVLPVESGSAPYVKLINNKNNSKSLKQGVAQPCTSNDEVSKIYTDYLLGEKRSSQNNTNESGSSHSSMPKSKIPNFGVYTK